MKDDLLGICLRRVSQQIGKVLGDFAQRSSAREPDMDLFRVARNTVVSHHVQQPLGCVTRKIVQHGRADHGDSTATP